MRKHLVFLLLPLALIAVATFFSLINNAFTLKSVVAQQANPNFVIIMTDDQRADTMDGMPITTTRLGGSGITFTNAYLTTPLCCPSRTSFLTGMYAHNTGIFKNDSYDKVKKFEDRMISNWMRQSGIYRTGFFGKYINKYDNKNVPGWDQWFGISGGRYFDYYARDNNQVKYFGKTAGDYSTDVIRRKAVNFIKDSQKPFFLVITPQSPHGDEKEGAVDGAVAAPRHRPCPDMAAYSSPAYNEDDVSDKPAWIRTMAKKPNTAIQTFRKTQYCALKAVDELVGEVLDTLDAKGIRDNTFIAYFSDNGYSWAEHRHDKKNCIYEGCARTPLIISYPPLTAPVAGQSTNSLVSHIDITATMIDLADLSMPAQVDGVSLKPILSDPQATVRDAVLIETNSDITNYKINAVRTKEWKYVEHANGERELYDLVNDPFELQSLHNITTTASIRTELAGKLHALLAQ